MQKLFDKTFILYSERVFSVCQTPFLTYVNCADFKSKKMFISSAFTLKNSCGKLLSNPSGRFWTRLCVKAHAPSAGGLRVSSRWFPFLQKLQKLFAGDENSSFEHLKGFYFIFYFWKERNRVEDASIRQVVEDLLLHPVGGHTDTVTATR